MSSPIDGGTVLITGASSGIGRSIAQQLAPRAARIVLVARRTERLEEIAKELRAANGALRVDVFGCDLADRAALDRFVSDLAERGGDVDVLINNAGLGDVGVFDKSSLAKQLFMIDVNVTALVRLTHAFLPGMVARRRGAVLNISSGFGLTYLPGFAGYVGTKHFVTGFTEALHTELTGTGVHACQVCPGPVATEFEQNVGNFSDQKVPAFLELSADDCAAASIGAIDRRRALVVPTLLFKLLVWLTISTPRWLTRLVLRPAGKRVRRMQEKALPAAS